MKDHFLKSLRNKSEEELLYIIKHKENYQLAAVEAAAELLSLPKAVKPDEENCFPVKQVEIKHKISHTQAPLLERTLADKLNDSFNLSVFFNSHLSKNLITLVSLGLFFLFLINGYKLYRHETWMIENGNLLRLGTSMFILIINHILFKIDHKKSNNFIGRCISDLIFIAFYFMLAKIHGILTNDNYSFLPGEDLLLASLFLYFFSFTIVIASYEVIIAIFKRLLRLVKWEIL